MSSASESGCGGAGTVACSMSEFGWSRTEDQQILIGRADLCSDEFGSPCDVSSEGLVSAGRPQCACLCDDAFPAG